MKKMKALAKKLWHFAFHTEGGLYLVFGVLTTAVSLAFYYGTLFLLRNFNSISKTGGAVISTVLKNVSGILFAYFTNRGIVFGSKAKGRRKFAEFAKFTASRLATFGLDMLLTGVMVDIMDVSPKITGALTTVIVIILNYVLSKVFVFVKK